MIQNSISGVLDDVVKVTANNMKMYAALHEAIFSNQPSVKTQVYLENGEARDIEIPCLGYIKSRVDRIDSTISMLTNATGNSIVRMSDGSYRKLYINRLDIPRMTTRVPGVANTRRRSDAITNIMASKVTVDIPVMLYNNEDTVELNIFAYHGNDALGVSTKYNIPSSAMKAAFEELKENNAISSYINYTDVCRTEPTDMTAYGGIYVLRAVDTESIDADENVEHKKIYYISDIAFRGKEGSIYPISQGDVLTLYNSNGYHDTRVRVDIIDKTKSFIKISYVDGYQPVTVGSQLFPYIDENRESAVVRYPVSSRYQYWIYPTLITKSGFRHEEGDCIYVNCPSEVGINDVLDLGKYIDKYRKDTYKTRDDWDDANLNSSVLETPVDAKNTSFTIVDVSRDISSSSYTKITQLESQKKSVENSIEYYRDRINVLRNIISSGTAAGTAAQNELSQVTQSLEDAQNEFNTLVFNISDELSSSALESKYEIHGVVKMPASDTGFECIGIEVRYRFIGNDTDIQKKEYYNLDGTNVPFNAWKYAPLYLRARTLDESTNTYRWDPNTIDQTSIVIPIETRYSTIINYRYVFEAGYPENPKKSPWSTDILVMWDATLERSSTKALQNINQADQVKASVNNTLSTNGIYRHIADSFTAGEKYFAHSADQIASGWVTEEQSPISLYEKMKEIATVGQQLNDAFNAVDINNFVFSIIDADGNVQEIQEGTNNTVNTITYMEMLKRTNGITINKVDTANTDYVGIVKYTLRIAAKSKYVRFTRVPAGGSLYGFTDVQNEASGNIRYKYNTDISANPVQGQNQALKVALSSPIIDAVGADFATGLSSTISSRYRISSGAAGFATVLSSEANKLLFNVGSTLAFADESYIDVPITVCAAPIEMSGNTLTPNDFTKLSQPIKSTIKLYACVGSYINNLNLTIGITFVTSPK